jgi:hypothetical protein
VIAVAAAAILSLAPNPSHFGDLVTARVRPGATPSFKPFVVRERHGSMYVLQCLDAACVPGPGPRRLHVGGVDVVIVPRATAAQVAKPLRSFRRQTQVPPPRYRIRPGLLRLLLGVAALVLLAAALLLLAPLARRLVPERRDERTPLERALDLVRGSLARDPADRRRALDLLARALGRRRETRDALDLAWSRPVPDETSVETLLQRVEHTR